jgi:hypothetical protein
MFASTQESSPPKRSTASPPRDRAPEIVIGDERAARVM